MNKDRAKQEVRERVWALLEQEQVVPPGVRGRIPAFTGAEAAAELLATLSIWREAAVVKAVPDKAQLPVRARALAEGKLVYMAVPKLAEAQPFYLLDPAELTVPVTDAASSKVAATVARRVDVEQMRPVDLIVCGSVAVNRQGVRLGKGAGYSDIEVALLHEAGLISPDTTIVTTVHSLQVVAGDLPETDHDFRVDFIVTPDEVIACGPPRRPRGLYWDSLPQEMIDAIPALATRRQRD
ncbi:5-formyltetrahydrofolate cyclo-ligase [Microbispora rosea subsp. aerata]|nr:5-formyltetrahydrofolate cyclo-ligase [Microbispora rosea]GGO19558.1 5-formyltetrahydrofolate cyclo-ligase [Microbispora rosea subsp. aerata]GIH54397.1 5-formyltetrahydrofolate cyclo-ligase [Microbispora rosea subsp. aerata]GLJ81369.1 5-formyltetrahydrofolate cyclo-ligase [Microbispora rosea subsp. aerata]